MPPPAATRTRRRTPRGRARKAPTFHVSVFNCMPEPLEAWERDWAELPADAISWVLHRLSLAELLLGGVAGVCRSWRRAAREEPEIWRYIDVSNLPNVPDFTRHATLANFMRSALRLSAGQCHTFCVEDLDADLFIVLAQRAPSLKSLHLSRCNRIIYNGGFANGIKKLPLLEELTLVDCYCGEAVLEIIAKACRCLKHFGLVHESSCHCYRINQPADDRKAFAIARMHGLRSLKLVGDNLGNEGLTAIIDNCPNLRYLYIRDCVKIIMDDNLTVKCDRIIMRYHEYFPPYDFSCCIAPMTYGQLSDYDYNYDDYHDLYLYSYLGDKIDAANLEEYERILDIKGMRRYLS